MKAALSSTDDALKAGRTVDESAVNRLSSSMDDLQRARVQLTPADRRLLDDAGRARAAAQETSAARGAAEQALKTLSGKAEATAKKAAPTANPAFSRDLETVTNDLARSLACDLVEAALLPTEKAAATANREAPPSPAGSLVEAATSLLVKRWARDSLDETVNWTSWAKGVRDSAAAVAGAAPSTTGQLPSGTRSGAFYYYVRLCHAFPT